MQKDGAGKAAENKYNPFVFWKNLVLRIKFFVVQLFVQKQLD